MGHRTVQEPGKQQDELHFKVMVSITISITHDKNKEHGVWGNRTAEEPRLQAPVTVKVDNEMNTSVASKCYGLVSSLTSVTSVSM